jgi:enoyl-CoA hydratase/carnithine racemase
MPMNLEIEGPLATISIDGYNDLNPMTQPMYIELFRYLRQIDLSPEIRVAILRGAGEHHFSAGGDLKTYHHRTPESLSVAGQVNGFWYPNLDNPGAAGVSRETLYGTRTLTPLIGAARGWCLGAAFMIFCLHTSIRVVGESTKFGFTEILRGLGGGASTMSMISGQIPRATVMWLAASGRHIDAREALRLGLVNEVVPDDQVIPRAREVAALVA